MFKKIVLIISCLLIFIPFIKAGVGIPLGWKWIPITYLSKKVIDGDTFDVDLDKNGKYHKKDERIRLLYVDTPELSYSFKGKNIKLGNISKNFLKKLLEGHNVRLWVDPKNSKGNYGRTLAILEVQGRNINMELIRQGHSYLDTRFGFPKNYQAYSRAETEAFRFRRGIWQTEKSRKKYLKRLKKEGKTVKAKENNIFIPGKFHSSFLKLNSYKNKFIQVVGTIIQKKEMRKKVQILYLKNNYEKNGIQIVVFKKKRELLDLNSIKIGDRIFLEGFVKEYKGNLEIILHWGKRA